jgi:predicted branched-subunit amino acid permease
MTSDNMREFLRGIGDQLPLQLGVVPFGLVFGVLGIASGLSPLQTILMSSIVFGGASQVVFAQLWATGTSPLIVGSSVAVINLRHMLYSAAVAKYLRPLSLRWRIILGYLLTDEAFAISIKRFETTDRPELAHYYLLGSGLTLWVCWQIATVIGVMAGATIPDELNLGFAIPLTFMALVLPNLRRVSDIAAATSAALVALFGQALPWNVWIIAAALVGIIVGGILSHWEDRA